MAEALSDTTALDITTLVIALVGLAAALVSLGWQIGSWLLSGARVRVGIAWGITTMTDGTLGPPIVSVEARNIGRAGASIVSWGFQLPDSRTVVPAMTPGSWHGDALPVTLAGGHSVTWVVDPDYVKATIRDSGLGNVEPRAFVTLGSGRREISKRGIKL